MIILGMEKFQNFRKKTNYVTERIQVGNVDSDGLFVLDKSGSVDETCAPTTHTDGSTESGRRKALKCRSPPLDVSKVLTSVATPLPTTEKKERQLYLWLCYFFFQQLYLQVHYFFQYECNAQFAICYVWFYRLVVFTLPLFIFILRTNCKIVIQHRSPSPG